MLKANALAFNHLVKDKIYPAVTHLVASLNSKGNFDGYLYEDNWLHYSADGKSFVRPETKHAIELANNAIQFLFAGSDAFYSHYESMINKKHRKPQELDEVDYLEIFNNAHYYFSMHEKIEKDAFSYLIYLLHGNINEAKKALEHFEKDIRCIDDSKNLERWTLYTALEKSIEGIY